jgi:alkylhydroperoxidase/carboxymuconolactone decarboxylase family protein YurZ
MPAPKARPSKLPAPPRPFESFTANHPAVARAYESLGVAARRAGPLSEREIALVKLGISIGSRLEGAAHAHTRKALAVGVEPDALRHVAILAVPTLGFPPMMAALGWVEETIEGKKKAKRKR